MPGVQSKDRVIEAQSDSGRWPPQALVSIHEGGSLRTHLVPAPLERVFHTRRTPTPTPPRWRRGGSTTRAPKEEAPLIRSVTRPRPDPTSEEFLARMETARGARGEMLTWPPRGRPIRAGLYAGQRNAPKPLEG